jgi:ADP-ribosylglycohydrolase
VTFTVTERIIGCLTGIATGDAIGKQSEGLACEDIARWYPHGIRGFEGTPNTVIPRYAGNSKRQWRIGETTDDTERSVAVARAIIAERQVSHESIGRELLRCTKCVHPGVRSLWEFHQAGDPRRVATTHDGCGAAIRVAPVGIFYTSNCMSDLVTGAREASISTHGGAVAIAAAAAVAAAVSGAIDGASPSDVLKLAERAATESAIRWPGSDAEAFAAAIHAIHRRLASSPVRRAAEIAADCSPNQPMTIVPLAIGLATTMASATDAVLLAANIGGDSDSVASIAAGILGAMYPDTVNEDWCAVVERTNAHDLAALGRELAVLRHSTDA